MKQYLWKIGGEAGFGILTTGTVFAKIASRLGYFIFDYIQYPSLVRGGHNTYDVAFSDGPVHALKSEVDMLVCLNKDTFDLHHGRLVKESIVVYDPEDVLPEGEFIKIAIPFRKMLSDMKAQVVMKNTIAMGVTLALLGADLTELNTILEAQFGKKGEEIVRFNKQFAQAGYDTVIREYKQHVRPILVKRENQEHLVITGNETFSLAASVAQCRLYVAYPMTPASTVLTVLAAWQGKTGMVVRHAEDEISVINTALGASIAGVRTAVGTSGGGFALMVESVSFAGVAEIPLVIFISQRPGPATGMPTWTEQGDLLFTVHSGHGEFPKIVLAPGDMEEMFELGIKAFDLADIYQTPVFVMSDMYLSESHRSLPSGLVKQYLETYKEDRGKLTDRVDSPYLRYRVTEDGISPRLRPGVKGFFYQSNSYEHLEDGHTTEDASERQKQVHKREQKLKTYLSSHFKGPSYYGDSDADTVFVGWGSVKGPVLEALSHLKDAGVKAGFIHFTHVFPLHKEQVTSQFEKKRRYILVENNSHGQFGKLLRMETGISLEEKILRYDGRPVSFQDIASYIIK